MGRICISNSMRLTLPYTFCFLCLVRNLCVLTTEVWSGKWLSVQNKVRSFSSTSCQLSANFQDVNARWNLLNTKLIQRDRNWISTKNRKWTFNRNCRSLDIFNFKFTLSWYPIAFEIGQIPHQIPVDFLEILGILCGGCWWRKPIESTGTFEPVLGRTLWVYPRRSP